ncbi:hypothetical protein D3C78_1827940 [compost metagenome]
MQRPANVAVARFQLVGAFEAVVALGHLRVQLGEISPQRGKAGELVQRVAKCDVLAVQVVQQVEVVRIERGKAFGEGLQVGGHAQYLYKIGLLYKV